MTLLRSAVCVLAALAFPASARLHAQQSALDRGSIQLGGAASFTSEGGDNIDERVTRLVLNPHVRYFVARGLAVGGEITLSTMRQGDSSVDTYGVGPSIAGYFSTNSATVYPFLSGSVRLSRTSLGGSGSSRASSLGGRLAGGLLFMLSPAVGLSSELFYQVDRFEFANSEQDRNVYGLALGVAAFVF